MGFGELTCLFFTNEIGIISVPVLYKKLKRGRAYLQLLVEVLLVAIRANEEHFG